MLFLARNARLVQELFAILVAFFIVQNAFANPAQCKKIRFSDVGWTDISATTALASVILDAMGYETKTTQLSVPVTFVSLKNKDLDIFLGNWMPSMAADIAPYQKDGSVETVSTLLKGAKYTVAVPKYVYEAGVHSVADLNRNSDRFQRKIYGIEPGNDGNRHIQKMISDGAFGLSSWKLIESSEQAMLMQVLQAAKRKQWIAFLGWEPHPMNQKLEMVYLEGGDAYFGPNKGNSTVYINSRKNYSAECPQVAAFLKKYTMSVESENVLMGMILDQKMDPKAAAKKWIQGNWNHVEPWLRDLKALNGESAVVAVKRAI
ncbi:MAG: choline ABC transporter substrate-binding protein [Bdellovibrio sp.]|nr:choline ABC transporter substrate-binding protein [Bdellovibrio sp.]